MLSTPEISDHILTFETTNNCFKVILIFSFTCFAVILWAPRSRINVNVIRVETESSSFDSVIDYSVEHSNSADARVVRDADAAVPVVGRRGDLSGASGSVFVVAVVLRHWVVVVTVDVGRRKWVVVGP